MKPMNAKQVEECLRSNGFIRSHGVGSHRGWFNPVTGCRTVVPYHGSEVLPQGTLKAIFEQAGMPKPKR